MMRLQQFFCRLLVCAFVAALPLASAYADSPQSFYVDPETLPPSLLKSPASEGSASWQHEIKLVLNAQKDLTTNNVATIRDEQHMRLELMTNLVGKDFTRERFPKTFSLLDHVLNDANHITETDKQFWHTRRPYLTDHRVKLLVDAIDASPSYPSGHTSESRVLAEVLGILYPDRLMALRAHADSIAIHRVEAGVHYPADVEGGRSLAMLIVGALMESDEFQVDLAVAQKEIAATQ